MFVFPVPVWLGMSRWVLPGAEGTLVAALCALLLIILIISCVSPLAPPDFCSFLLHKFLIFGLSQLGVAQNLILTLTRGRGQPNPGSFWFLGAFLSVNSQFAELIFFLAFSFQAVRNLKAFQLLNPFVEYTSHQELGLWVLKAS